MVFCFSGTGNSAYVARRVAAGLGTEALDLFEKIKRQDHREIQVKGAGPLVVISPTYAWQIPRILKQWLEKTPLSGGKEIYFIMTCAGGIGNAGKSLQALSERKGMEYKGCFPVVMPENYVAMFTAPDREETEKIMEQAEGEIDRIICLLKAGESFPEPALTVKDRLSSGIVNALFYPFFVHAKKFYAEDSCISCGKCAKVCPLGNIHLENGKPVWGKACTHCMACICRCPTQAIEYGAHTKGALRYTCPK